MMNKPDLQKINILKLKNGKFRNKSNIENCIIYSDQENDIFNLRDLLFTNEISRISFKNCIFELSVKINSIEFNSNLDIVISDVEFKNDLIISNINFHQPVLFSNITCRGEFIIDKVNFDGGCSFNYCNFGVFETRNTSFNNLSVDKTEFEEYALFDCRFKGNSRFYDCKFMSVNFNNSIFEVDRIIFDKINFYNLGLFRNLYLDEKIIFNNCDLTHCSFLFSTFENVNFCSCMFNLSFMVDLRIKEPRLFPGEEIMCYGFDERDKILEYNLNDIINTYRMFENNFDKKRNYELAGKFHIKLMNLLRESYKNQVKENIQIYNDKKSVHPGLPEKKIFNKFTLNIENNILRFNHFINYFYKILSNYGESVLKPFLLFILIFILFSLLYSVTGLRYYKTALKDNIHQQDTVILQTKNINDLLTFNEDAIISTMMYSLNNSIPIKIKYEKVTSESNITVSFSMLQLILQTILLTLLILALKRKFRR